MHDSTHAPGSIQALQAHRILAIDLGKFTSVACDYDSATGKHTFTTIPTRPQDFHDLLVERLGQTSGGRLVIEIGSAAGWVKDMAEALKIEIQIANPNHEAWRWKNVKRKTDKDDALKLAQLSVMGQLPTLVLPSSGVRQWRSMIAYRWTLVGRRTAIKNSIRAILDRQGLTHASGKKGWTKQSLAGLGLMAYPIDQVDADELWRGQLDIELTALDQIEGLIKQVEAKLEALAKSDKRVEQLQSIPGVGPRLAEVVVATIDDPKRFKSAKQVGAYAGLVPKQYESGAWLPGHDEQAGSDHRPGQQVVAGAARRSRLVDAALQPGAERDLRPGLRRQQGKTQDRGGRDGAASAGDVLGDAARWHNVESAVAPTPGSGPGSGASVGVTTRRLSTLKLEQGFTD